MQNVKLVEVFRSKNRGYVKGKIMSLKHAVRRKILHTHTRARARAEMNLRSFNNLVQTC